MNRLQLCQRLRQEAGIAGTGPATTIGQIGEAKRVVDWCDDAWQELRSKHLWSFLWEQASVVITAATYFTAGTIDPRRYIKNSCYDGTRPLKYLPWADFKERYPLALIADGVPTHWTIRPDNAFAVSAKPTANLTLAVERYSLGTAMTADTDVPGFPAANHMVIVYKALLLYANFEEAGVTRATAEREFKRHLSELGLSSLPDVTFGYPLA